MRIGLETFKHLLPSGKAWRLTIDRKLRQFFEGLSVEPGDAQDYQDGIWNDYRPFQTTELDKWEDQFGLLTPVATELQRRERLDAEWKALGGQSPRYLQDIIQAAGFPLFIHEWWVPGTDPPVPRNPNSWIAPLDQAGINWKIRVSAADNNWRSIIFGNDLFVAVASTGTGNRVMTSPDGINWTIRVSAADNVWLSVTFGNGLFVAVSNSGTGDRVMTSPDGINWTIRVSAIDNQWRSVTFGNSLFVAVASTGIGNRVMTSPDGINWTIRVSAADNQWRSVTFGNSLFVAVASNGTGDRVMTSPDGINWTIRVSAADNKWRSVTFGNSLFVAVASTGIGNRVMTSPDGINWTIRVNAADNQWFSITFGNGLFVAVAATGTGDRVMTSPDGINWTIRVSAIDNAWSSVTFVNGLFVAVAATGTGNRVMTSSEFDTGSTVIAIFGGLSVQFGGSTAQFNKSRKLKFLLTDNLAKPVIWPRTNINDYPLFVYFGGAVFGESVNIPAERYDELKTLILKLCPAQLWIGLFAEIT